MIDLTPHARLTHWSEAFRGLPWVAGADGPHAFDCWGLVRHVQREHYGRELPRLAIDPRHAEPSQWTIIRTLVQRSAWRRLERAPADGDVLLMLNAEGLPHIGTVLGLSHTALLHAVGFVDQAGESHGSVRVDALPTLTACGYGHFEAWGAA